MALSISEIEALGEAGSWFANYHARIIRERAHEGSAYARAQRERYFDLLSALEKLGFDVRNPLAGDDSSAARRAA